MRDLKEVEQTVRDRYEGLRQYTTAGQDITLNGVTHLMLREILPLSDENYEINKVIFRPENISRLGKDIPTVALETILLSSANIIERLFFIAVPFAYPVPDSSDILDLTIQAYDDAKLKPRLCENEHTREVKRTGGLNMYVYDVETGITATVMDDSLPPHNKFPQVTSPILSEIIVRLGSDVITDGLYIPNFTFIADHQQKAEQLMQIYALLANIHCDDKSLEMGNDWLSKATTREKQARETIESKRKKLEERLKELKEHLID